VDGAGGKLFGAQSVWQQAMLEVAEEAEQRAAEAASAASARANLDSLKPKDLAAGADNKADHDLADM
jgi:hypothetical protein